MLRMLQSRPPNRRTPTAPNGVMADAQPVAIPPEPLARPPSRTPLQTPPAGKGPAHAWPRKR